MIAVTATIHAVAWAEPFIPADDAVVVETLPYRAADPSERALRALRRQLDERPTDAALAVEVVRGYIERGRVEGDPRYYGYAEAVLRPWWNAADAPPAVLVMRATLYQSRHEFDAALVDLERVLAREPDNGQAWITRAVIQQVRGDYAGAVRSCRPLTRLSTELVATACAAGAAGLNGRLEESRAALERALRDARDARPGERVWALTLLAEMAERAGRPAEAEGYFDRALALDRPDTYLLAAYADFLLAQGRPAAVIDRLANATRNDPLLLRLTLAERALGREAWRAHAAELADRFEAARRRGDRTHLREQARFALELTDQPREALALARANWTVQREPWDARLLLAAGAASGDVTAVQTVLDWIAATGLEDGALTGLAERARTRGGSTPEARP